LQEKNEVINYYSDPDMEKYIIIGIGILVALALLSIMKTIVSRIISIAVVLAIIAWFIF
jgi:hypothetical protein